MKNTKNGVLRFKIETCFLSNPLWIFHFSEAILISSPWNVSKELPSVSFLFLFKIGPLWFLIKKMALPTKIASSSRWTVSVFPKKGSYSLTNRHPFSSKHNLNFSNWSFQGKIVAQGKLLLRGPLFCTDDPTSGPNFKMKEMTVFLFEQVPSSLSPEFSTLWFCR